MPPSKKDLSSSRCVVPGCTSVCLQVGSHCFPKDLELSKAWVEAIRNPMLRDIDSLLLHKNYHVCKLHFSSKDYIPRTTKARLRKNVVPSLRLPTDIDENVTTTATVVSDEQCAVSSSDTGLNATLLRHLKNAVKKFSDDRDKLVSLVWDEMKLQAQLHHDLKADKIVGFEDWGSGRTSVFADHALVFMIRGIKRNWKMPISFTFCSGQTKTDRLSHLIKRHIAALKRVGLTVAATVCDPGSANIAAINALKQDTRRLLLKSGQNADVDQMIIHGMTITPLYDVPHLLKTLRNNLLLKHLEFKQQEQDDNRHFAKWDHLEIMYLLDLNLDTDLRGIWKIGQYHIVPKSIKKMKVKYAAQVFSRTMTSRIALAASHECATPAGVKMPKEALDTSRFLLFVDKLFDSLNGGAGEKNPTALRRAVSTSTGHRRFWMEAVQFLRNSSFVDKYTLRRASRSNSCLAHWIQTVQGFIHLWSRLLRTEEFFYFAPRNLNQDALENFFGAIRSHGWRNVMPSCAQFIGAYKSLLINNLTSYHSLSANCEDDEGELLFNFAHTLEEGGVDHSNDSDSIESDALPFAPQVYAPTAGTALSKAALAYTAGYVARRLLKSVKNCSKCQSNVLAASPNPDLHCNLQSREYNSNVLALHYVSKDFLDSFVRCDEILRKFLPSECFLRNVSKRMQAKLDEENLDWLTCAEHASAAKLYFKKLTVSLQIHAFCTNVNNILSGKEIRYGNGANRMFRQAMIYRSTHSKRTL